MFVSLLCAAVMSGDPSICQDSPLAGLEAVSSDDLAIPNQFTVQADRIILSEDFELARIDWKGIYVDSTPCGPLTDDFFINVFEGGDSVPDVGQLTHAFEVGAVERSLTGQLLQGRDEYLYSVVLPQTIALQSGQTYWIEIYNNAPPAQCEWSWVTSSTGDGVSAGGILDGNEYIYNVPWSFDFSMCLFAGTAVPAASTWALIGLSTLLAAAGATVIQRRRSAVTH
jgi:hypothetical protein